MSNQLKINAALYSYEAEIHRTKPYLCLLFSFLTLTNFFFSSVAVRQMIRWYGTTYGDQTNVM